MEHKFRGKRVDNGEWVYGSLIHEIFDGSMYIFPEGAQVEHYYNGNAEVDRLLQVHPESVDMFTGLKDKDKADIYEKDWITNCSGLLWQVYFDKETAAFRLMYQGEASGNCRMAQKWIIETECEVTDTPELLKEG